MNKYTQDTYLLSSQFQLIASWWDSMVFIDKNDSSVIIKLYDPLEYAEVARYYAIQRELVQKVWIMNDGEIELQITDPSSSDKFLISETEDGVLVALPRVVWCNLASYGTDIQRTQILHRVKFLLKSKGLPISGWFEVKPENIMVSDRQWWKRLVITITDIWARVDECLKEYWVL